MIASPPIYSIKEEIANSITHGLGILLSVAALVLLVVFSALNGNVYHVVSSSIYGACLILLYTSSTLYHSFQSPKIKRFFRYFDHFSIYLLIAGTYTPLTLVSLKGPWGWTLFGLVWGISITGIIIEAVTRQQFKKLSLGLYIALGWLIVIAIVPLMRSMETGGLLLLLFGGLFYTGGVFFYVKKSLVFNHAIWHLFVLCGSCLHFFMVFYYIVP